MQKKIPVAQFPPQGRSGKREKGGAESTALRFLAGPEQQKTAHTLSGALFCSGIEVPGAGCRYRLRYFLLKPFIVMAVPTVTNERTASTKTFSRSGRALRSSSVHSPSTYST